MRGTLVAALGALALVGSCETMSADQCAVADWRALGVTDGAAGAGVEKFTSRQNSCAKTGVKADFELYQRGRDEGLRTFCQAPSGFRAGLSGYSYASACPADLEGEFMLGYRDGSYARTVTQALSTAQTALNSARDEVSRLDDKIAVFDAQANDSTRPASERDASRARARELRADRDHARDSARDAERDLYRKQDDLDHARRDIGLRWGSW